MSIYNKLKASFNRSNHKKHFFYAIPIGLVGTMLMVIGCAGGMEFKDKEHGSHWSWPDIWWTLAGGLIGQILQIILILILC